MGLFDFMLETQEEKELREKRLNRIENIKRTLYQKQDECEHNFFITAHYSSENGHYKTATCKKCLLNLGVV